MFDVRYGKTLPTKNLDPNGLYPVYGGGVIGRYNNYVAADPTCFIISRGNGSGTVWRTTESAFVTNNFFLVTSKGRFDALSFGFAELFSKNVPIIKRVGSIIESLENLLLRLDDFMDAGRRAMYGAVAERVGLMRIYTGKLFV